MSKYIDGDTLDEVRDAFRQGTPIVHIATKLGIEPDDLRHRPGLPCATAIPRARQDFDLFASVRTDAFL